MGIKLWICKWLTKRIEANEKKILEFKIAIDTLRKWIKQDKKKLQERLKQLSDEENFDYGIQCGFTDETELKTIRRKGK